MKKILSDNILARDVQPQQKTEGGVYIADTSVEKYAFEVVGIGEEVEHVQIGDVVYIPSRVGANIVANKSIKFEGEDLVVLTENQIIYLER